MIDRRGWCTSKILFRRLDISKHIGITADSHIIKIYILNCNGFIVAVDDDVLKLPIEMLLNEHSINARNKNRLFEKLSL